MSVFISYSRKDAGFVDKLSLALTEHNVKVWKDDMKIIAGDSLSGRIKSGIENASYFCIVLSHDSLNSKWVQEEINEALVRETEQKGIVILPIVLDDCEIPPVLKDRLFVDFRGDFDSSLKRILNVVAIKYNIGNSGRIANSTSYYFDYGIEYQIIDGRFFLQIDAVSYDTEESFTILSQFKFVGNEYATREHFELDDDKSLRDLVLRTCAEEFAANPARIPLNAKQAKTAKFFIQGTEDKARFDAELRVKWLGTATRETVVFNVGALIEQICKHSGIHIANEDASDASPQTEKIS
jgi:hypothetical protein